MRDRRSRSLLPLGEASTNRCRVAPAQTNPIEGERTRVRWRELKVLEPGRKVETSCLALLWWDLCDGDDGPLLLQLCLNTLSRPFPTPLTNELAFLKVYDQHSARLMCLRTPPAHIFHCTP